MPNFQLSGNRRTQRWEVEQLITVVRHRIESWIELRQLFDMTGRLVQIETPQNLLPNSHSTMLFLCFERNENHPNIIRVASNQIEILGEPRMLRLADGIAHHNPVYFEPHIIDIAQRGVEFVHDNVELNIEFNRVLLEKFGQMQHTIQQHQDAVNEQDGLRRQLQQSRQNAEQQQHQNQELQQQLQQSRQAEQQLEQQLQLAQQQLATARATTFDLEREARRREDVVRRLQEEWSRLGRIQDNENVNNIDEEIPNTQ